MTMRAPLLASMAAVAAPRPDAEPVTITHKPSFDIRISSCDFELTARDAPYRAAKCLQIGKTPLRGINAAPPVPFMSPLQGRLRTSALVTAVAFPHHAVQEKTASRCLGAKPDLPD
jgi:hypothetical protein